MPREKSSPHRKSLPETQQLVKEMCPRDNYRTQNEFIEKAIRFYAGYVSGQDTTAYLPPALASVLRGTVQDTENRVCRLLFKLAVDLDMMMNVLAAGMEIPDEQLKALRGRCGCFTTLIPPCLLTVFLMLVLLKCHFIVPLYF